LAELSPRATVRVPQRSAAGKRWTGRYVREIPIAQATAIPDRPVAMYATAEFTPEGEVATDPDWYLIPLDLDAKTDDAVAQVAQDTVVLQSYLGAGDIPYVTAISGPSNGRHIWIAAPAGIPGALVRRLAAAAKRVCPSLDSSPLRNMSGFGCLRPPGSPHRRGGRSELDGIGLDEAITRLKAGASPAQIEQLVQWLEEEAALLPEPETAIADGTLPPSVLRHGPERVRTLEFDDTGRLKLPGEIRALDERGRRALETPLDPADDHDHKLFPTLRGLARARFTCDEAWQLAKSGLYPGLAYLTSERQPGGRRRPRSESEGRRVLERQWMLACEVEARRPAGHAESEDPAPEVTAAVAALWAHLGGLGPARWAQQSGPADMGMALFVGLQMLAAARLDVSLGTRRAANATGWCHETCNQALNRLRDRDQVLTELDKDTKYHNRRVTIAPAVLPADESQTVSPEGISSLNTGLTQARNGRGVLGGHREDVALTRAGLADHGSRALALLASDLFAHGGPVGHHGGRTWLIIESASGLLSLSHLIQETGYGERTVRRHMAALSDAGLVAGDPLGGWLRTDRALEDAARECESAGTREGRALRYALDQLVWKWWTGEVSWMKLPREEKRHQPRVPARQGVFKVGRHPAQGRRFPRRTCGAPDHSEAARLLTEDLGVQG
jgi:hypothetical protein